MLGLFQPVIAWVMRSFLPYLFVAGGFIAAYFMGWLKSILFWILAQLLALFEMFLSFVTDGTTLFQYLTFDGMPPDMFVFVGFLRVPECMGILLTAYAIRLVRKTLLRF